MSNLQIKYKVMVEVGGRLFSQVFHASLDMPPPTNDEIKTIVQRFSNELMMAVFSKSQPPSEKDPFLTDILKQRGFNSGE